MALGQLSQQGCQQGQRVPLAGVVEDAIYQLGRVESDPRDLCGPEDDLAQRVPIQRSDPHGIGT